MHPAYPGGHFCGVVESAACFTWPSRFVAGRRLAKTARTRRFEGAPIWCCTVRVLCIDVSQASLSDESDVTMSGYMIVKARCFAMNQCSVGVSDSSVIRRFHTGQQHGQKASPSWAASFMSPR